MPRRGHIFAALLDVQEPEVFSKAPDPVTWCSMGYAPRPHYKLAIYPFLCATLPTLSNI